MEIRQLQYFMEVAKREHMTEAAHHLHVAQSAVSLQIGKLEAELGVALFERSGRNIKLTHIGQIFLDDVSKAMKNLEQARDKVNEYLNPDKGTVKVGYPTSLAGNLLPTVVSAFRERNADITFHLKQGSYANLIDSVKNGDIDLAFLGPVPTKDPDLIGEILFTEKLSALIPANHRLASKVKVPLTDFREEGFVLFPNGYILREMAIEACRQAGFVPRVSSEGEDMDAIKGLVSAGMGVTLLPDSTLFDTNSRMTVRMAIQEPEVKRTVGIIKPKNREIAPSEQLFYRFTIDFFKLLEQYR